MAFDYPNWPYGYGLGTASLGVQYVTRIMHATPMWIGVENGYGQIILELGILGLILWIVLGISIAFSGWHVVKRLKGTPWFPLSFALFAYATILFLPISFYGFSAYQDFIINAYVWLLLGILFRLETIPKMVQFEEAKRNLIISEQGQ